MQSVFIDGKLLPKEQAKVSVYDHGLLYGDGVFEGIRAYHGRVFRLHEHVQRLFDSAKAIALDIPMTHDEVVEAVLDTLRANRQTDGYVRLVVTRGVGDLGLDPGKCPKASIIIIADRIELYPQSFYEKGLSVVTVCTRRQAPTALDPAVKSLNYLNNILGKIEVKRAGVQEGIMLNAEGYVAEATGDNIFIVKQARLLTPPESAGILIGVTRNAVMELARKAGIEVEERMMTQLSFYTADECFLTGTAAEVVPVVRIDDRIIGDGKPGPITHRLSQDFHALTQVEGVPIHTDGIEPVERIPVVKLPPEAAS